MTFIHGWFGILISLESGLSLRLLFIENPDGVYKINVNGSRDWVNDNPTCGELICDYQGKFIKDFYCNLSKTNVIFADMCALLHGLRLAIAHNMKLLQVILIDLLRRYDDISRQKRNIHF